MSKLICLIILFYTCIASAQTVQRDTSFTPYSAWQKELKKYPFITIAQPLQTKNVLHDRDLVYRRGIGRNLTLDVLYPRKKNKHGYPGVLLIFGGGWRSGDKSQSIPMAMQLAAAGYVAVAIDYTLSTEAPYPAAVHDIKTAIRYMRAHAKKYRLDTTKIATHGVSAGGQLAALVGTTNGNSKLEGTGYNQHSGGVQAIIDIDGVLAFKHPESSEGKVAAEFLGGTSAEKPATWEEASALTHAGKNTPPILFINSSQPRFHAGRDDLINKLKPFNIYTEVHTIPDTPHPFWLFNPWFDPTVKWTIEFLDKIFKTSK